MRQAQHVIIIISSFLLHNSHSQTISTSVKNIVRYPICTFNKINTNIDKASDTIVNRKHLYLIINWCINIDCTNKNINFSFFFSSFFFFFCKDNKVHLYNYY